MSTYDGHTLEMMVDNMTSTTGSGLIEAETWTFRVVTQQLYWQTADTVKVRMYKNEMLSMPIQLNNSTVNQRVNNVSLAAKDGTLDDWLSFTPLGNFSVTPAGTSIEFAFDANQAIGIYYETIEVNGLAGQKPLLVIELEILPQAPNWHVIASDFSGSMNIVANWKFSTQTEQGAMSTDVRDIMSVWIDGELRGVANIELAGNNFHVAYLSIFGSPAADGEVLAFRVWDADNGQEYNATPDEEMVYTNDDIIGNTAAPEVVVVNKSKDKIEDIPLNQGWTWFSINKRLNDMSVDNVLASLTTETDGDIIKTGDKFAQYTDGVGWIANGIHPLTTIDVNEGYLIYLHNGPDTLTIAGSDAIVGSITLTEGWNWIGYPLQEPRDLNGSFSLTNISGSDVMKTVRQEGDAPFAQYSISTNLWTGSLTTLEPFDAYKFQMIHPNGGELTFGGTSFTVPFEKQEVLTKFLTAADPQNPATWVAENLNYQYTMPLIAEILFDDSIRMDTNDIVALFVGNDLRGVAHLESINEIQKTVISLLVGGTTVSEKFTVHYYNAIRDEVHEDTDTLMLNLTINTEGSLGFGKYSAPYLINIDVDSKTGCVANGNYGGDIFPNLYKVANAITSDGVVKAYTIVEFRAGNTITFNEGFEVENMASFLAIIENCASSVRGEETKEQKKVSKSQGNKNQVTQEKSNEPLPLSDDLQKKTEPRIRMKIDDHD